MKKLLLGLLIVGLVVGVSSIADAARSVFSGGGGGIGPIDVLRPVDGSVGDNTTVESEIDPSAVLQSLKLDAMQNEDPIGDNITTYRMLPLFGLGDGYFAQSDEWQRKTVELEPEEQISVADLINQGLLDENGEIVLYDNGIIRMEYYEDSYSGQELIYIEAEGVEYSMVTLKVDPTTQNVTKVLALHPRDTVTVKLSLASDMPLYDWLRDTLELPDVTDEMLATEDERQEERDELAAALAEIQPQTDRYRSPMNLPPNGSYVSVLQGSAGVTSPDTEQPYLLTFGAGPCVIITLYDPTTGIGALAHLDAVTDVRGGINSMKYHMVNNGADGESIESRLVGGNRGSEELILDIYTALEMHEIEIVERDILGYGSRAIVLDTSTGEIYDLIGTPPVDDVRLMFIGMRMPGSPLTLERGGLIDY
ncbi:MAG: hypothetical protein P9X27_04195 [Candidatus Kaelpia aquatica]|nr:hypothetical protein [Candidatus Kaelpia aquatica]